MKDFYDVIIVGCGSSGFGSGIRLSENSKKSILVVDRLGGGGMGLANDCKINVGNYKIGFTLDNWTEEQANKYLKIVEEYLDPNYTNLNIENLDVYIKRAKKYNTELLLVKQAHIGTDKSKHLIKKLMDRMTNNGVEIQLKKEIIDIDYDSKKVIFDNGEQTIFGDLIIAVGRKGAFWFQEMMKKLDVKFNDNVVDVGVRLELNNIDNKYPIIKDFYDPKFWFNDTSCRTFCTNSGKSGIVTERYDYENDYYYSVNGHSLSSDNAPNNLVNFSLLKTITLSNPETSGLDYGRALGKMAMVVGNYKPIMQRISDLRLGKRSKKETFNEGYSFKPTLASACPGNIKMAMPAFIFEDIWKSLKILDSITGGIMNGENILYYPEVKTYSTKPVFIDDNFQVKKNIWVSGDCAGNSRGITAAMCAGVRVADGILSKI